MSSMRMLARNMTAEELTIPLSALVTHLDVTVFMCHRIGARRSEGTSTGASTGASDPNRRWATVICGRPARHERRIADA
jgi:hypothetical protein